MRDTIRHYGVLEQVKANDPSARAVEDLRLLGYAVVDGGYSSEDLERLSERFDVAQARYTERNGGYDALRAIDEHRTIRALLAEDRTFLDLARNKPISRVCKALLGEYFILNQQNGIVNPPHRESYNQAAFHRDLPYQHFVSSKPLAINALFCLDEFTLSNGATYVMPASHKQEPFPSDSAVLSHSLQVTAPRGHFIVLDCMVYHSGGVNTTDRPRRAINHVYTIPLLRQQVDLPTILGDAFEADSETAKFLGYAVRTPPTVEAYLGERRSRLGGSKQ